MFPVGYELNLYIYHLEESRASKGQFLSVMPRGPYKTSSRLEDL
jgi:hypothetical protein